MVFYWSNIVIANYEVLSNNICIYYNSMLISKSNLIKMNNNAHISETHKSYPEQLQILCDSSAEDLCDKASD